MDIPSGPCLSWENEYSRLSRTWKTCYACVYTPIEGTYLFNMYHSSTGTVCRACILVLDIGAFCSKIYYGKNICIFRVEVFYKILARTPTGNMNE